MGHLGGSSLLSAKREGTVEINTENIGHEDILEARGGADGPESPTVSETTWLNLERHEDDTLDV